MNSETISAWASKFTLLSVISTFLSWLASSEAAVLIGIAATLGGSFVNWYYKREANKRLLAEHALRQQERQIRIDLMRSTGMPVAAPKSDSDLMPMGEDD